MEDVVVHFRSEPAGVGVTALVQSAEKLLRPFPCRLAPHFMPWFPFTELYPLPIRPAKPAPVIIHSGDPLPCGAPTETAHTTASFPGNQQTPDDVKAAETTGNLPADASVSETPDRLLPSLLCPKPNRGVAKRQTQDGHDGAASMDVSPLKRHWSVFTGRSIWLRGFYSLSKDFDRMVSVHRLRPHQRAKWVITEQSCGTERDMEQVWRVVSSCVRSGVLPGCNAHLQKERGETWVFCDMLQSEQVGQVLKEALQLKGAIILRVHTRGNVFTL